MDYFVPEDETCSLQQQSQQCDEQEHSEYASPLSSRSRNPETHYNNGATSNTPYKSPSKTPFSGFCDACKMKLNSYTQSKSHYEGKPHARKVKAQAQKEESEQNPEAAPGDEPPNKKARTVDVTSLFCEACNLTFTSEAHAKDHYLGRNHARVLHGLAPYTQGPPDPRVAAQLLSSEPPADMEGKPAHQDKPKLRGKFHCEVCNCSLTCEQQQASHLAGSRHAKMMKKLGTESGTDKEEGDDSTAEGTTGGPPTVQFKCEVCNIGVNSATQYKQHMESKKHSGKLALLNQDTNNSDEEAKEETSQEEPFS